MKFKTVIGLLVLVLAMAAPVSGATKIVHWHMSGQNDAWVEKMAEQFTQETGIEIELVSIHVSTIHDKLVAAIASGIRPDTLMDHSGYGMMALTEWFADLRPFIESDSEVDLNDYMAPSVRALTVPEGLEGAGNLIGMPWGVWGLTFARNVSIWENAGVTAPASDWTWEDFKEAAMKLRHDSDGDGVTDMYGVTIPLNETRVGPIIHNAGTYWFDRHVMPTKSQFQNETVLAVLGDIKELFERGAATQSRSLYRNGTGSAIDIQASPNYHEMLASVGMYNEFLHRPSFPNGNTGTELAIISVAMLEKSNKKDAAWQWIKYLTARTDLLEDLINDPEYQRMPAHLEVAQTYFDAKMQINPSFKNYFDVVASPQSYPRIEHPEFRRMEDLINDYLERALEAGSISLQEMAIQLDSQLEPILAKYR